MLQNVAQIRVLLILFSLERCNSLIDDDVLTLQISNLKGTDFVLNYGIVVEKIGANLSLRCELMCSLCSHPQLYYDDPALSWTTSSGIKALQLSFKDFLPNK